MMFSKEIHSHIERASQIAFRSRHEYILPEHIILSILLHEPQRNILSSLESCNTSPENAISAISDYLSHHVPTLPTGVKSNKVLASVGFSRLINNAILHAQLRNVTPQDVWVCFLEDANLDGSKILNDLGVTAFHVKRFLSHGSSGMTDQDLYPEAAVFNSYGVCLTQKARQGQLDAVVGREDLIDDIILDLSRRRKANLLLTGDPGVGKTSVVEGLALKLTEENAPENLKKCRIWQISLADLVANSSLRGEFEERIKQMISTVEKYPDVILFIDEIHQIIGLGKGSGASDAANLLKPALARNSIRMIGATTSAEAQRIFEKDKALKRRFIRREVAEPTETLAIQMIQSALPALSKHHHVSFADDVPALAVSLAAKHIRDLRLPDSALDILDHFGSRHRDMKKSLTASQLFETASKFLSLPLHTLKGSAPQHLKEQLSSAVFCQDAAVDSLYKHVIRAQAGLNDPTKPLGAFLFAGPTGVGKTEMAKQLAESLSLPLVRFDLSEYQEAHSVGRLTGAPPSYIGYEDGGQLTKAMHSKPACVLLFDEVEKAHPNILQLFLQIMDYGTLTDSQGETINFRQAFIIFTSNVGTDVFEKRGIGFAAATVKTVFDPADSIKKHFTPEFRNRLSSVVSFQPLPMAGQSMIVDKQLKVTQSRLTQAELSWDSDFCAAVAAKAYDPALGARPIERWLDEHVRTPLSEFILQNSFALTKPHYKLNFDSSTEKVVIENITKTIRRKKRQTEDVVEVSLKTTKSR
jgi:ATP-dependent Clp protease ATP-binding subunit ClpA